MDTAKGYTPGWREAGVRERPDTVWGVWGLRLLLAASIMENFTEPCKPRPLAAEWLGHLGRQPTHVGFW